MVACCDLNEKRLQSINSIYPAIEVSTDCKSVIENSQIDLVTVCTPVNTHFEIAKAALEAGKHVLIEKPMTSSSKDAE